MTYKKHWLDLFDYYKKDPTIVSRLPYKDLVAITSRVLFNKRNLEQHIQRCRADCQKELERQKSNIKKHESALIKKEILYDERLSVQFDEVESYWKKIEAMLDIEDFFADFLSAFHFWGYVPPLAPRSSHPPHLGYSWR